MITNAHISLSPLIFRDICTHKTVKNTYDRQLFLEESINPREIAYCQRKPAESHYDVAARGDIVLLGHAAR